MIHTSNSTHIAIVFIIPNGNYLNSIVYVAINNTNRSIISFSSYDATNNCLSSKLTIAKTYILYCSMIAITE